MTWNPIDPPHSVNLKVRDLIHQKLNPTLKATLIKLAAIHLIMGPLTLLFCPQFGISPLKINGLYFFYEKFGHTACTIACGITYVSLSLIIASILYSPEEIKLLRHSKSGMFAVLSSLSLGFFVFLGAEVFVTFTLWWLLGVFIGSMATLEVAWQIRKI